MLVITRRTGESILIGKDIALTVLGVKGQQARIGIEAPKNVPIDREEIHVRKMREKSGADANGNVEKAFPDVDGNR